MCLGVPGCIERIDDEATFMATVNVNGVLRGINVACVTDPAEGPQTLIGKWVLVHVGFAMSIIDEAEAAKTLDLLRELGEADLELERMSLSS